MEAVGAFFIVFDIYGYGRTNQAFKSAADEAKPGRILEVFRVVYGRFDSMPFAAFLSMLREGFLVYTLLALLCVPVYRGIVYWTGATHPLARLLIGFLAFLAMGM
jgi:hypothetical protein